MLIDIAECAVAVLSEPVEKHDRNVYEMGSESLTNEQRAAVFSKVLGKTIACEEQSMQEFYNTRIAMGMSHSFVYNYALIASKDICQPPRNTVKPLLLNTPRFTPSI